MMIDYKTYDRDLLMFIYGRKVRVKYKNSIRRCVMQLNPNNNFFLEFIAFEDKLKIILQVFIPYISGVRCKLDKSQVKVRMEKYEDSIYIYSESERKLQELTLNIDKLIKHVKKFKYASFSWRNLLYNLLYELKIYKNKEKIFSDEDVKDIIYKMKLKNPALEVRKHICAMREELEEYGLKMLDIDLFQENNYFNDIKNNIFRMFKDKDSPIDIKLVEKTFEHLAIKNELGNIFRHYVNIEFLSDEEEPVITNKLPSKNSSVYFSSSNFYIPRVNSSVSKSNNQNILYCSSNDPKSLSVFNKRNIIKKEFYFEEERLQAVPKHETCFNEGKRRVQSFSTTKLKNSISKKEEKNPNLVFSTLAKNAVLPLDFTGFRMKFKNFYFFLEDYQKMNLSKEFKEKLQMFFNQIRIKSIFDYNYKKINYITFEEFCMFIFSKLNSIIDVEKSDIYSDKKMPLSCFFINSSHNTYLTGHQLYGKSGVEGYQRALEKGCRCIEIDCWDGANGPVVTHGHTFIKNYPFSDIIKILAKEAFIKNNFPLIISLEMHCNFENRVIIAYEIEKCFGERLFIPDKNQKLLILSELMGKVLIKTSLSKSKKNLGEPHSKKEVLQLDRLSQITALFSIKKLNPSDFSSNSILSLSESKMCMLLWEIDGLEYVKKLNTKILSRVYPDATRIASDNYNPLEFWSAGCHMIALNIQSPDEHILMNQMMFLENGGSKGGFVPKPTWLLSKIIPQRKRYKIEVLSAQILNSDLLDESDYLEVSFKGHPMDEEINNKKFILNFYPNFLHPSVIQSREKVFFEILYSELAFFVFKITNKSRLKNIALVKANCVRPGLRVLCLYDSQLFHNYYSFLLLRIIKKTLYESEK